VASIFLLANHAMNVSVPPGAVRERPFLRPSVR
jgi:hypothetical protein